MPYDKVRNHPDCGSGQIAVVKKGSNERLGCHDSEQSADDQIAAIHAREGAQVTEVLTEDTLGRGDPSPGTPADERLKRNKKKRNYDGDDVEGLEVDVAEVQPTGEPTGFVTDADAAESDGSWWQGVLAVEGTPTGDGREFAADSLNWPEDLEAVIVPLRWNVEESHGGEQRTTAVNVGRITEISRDGNLIRGRGQFDVGGEHGREAARLVNEKFLRGVSVDVDDIKNSDVEMIFPENDEGESVEEDGDVIRLLFAAPEKIVYNKARIRGATLTNLPAFVEAYVEAADGTSEAAAVPMFGAVPPHDSLTSDVAADQAGHEARLPRTLSHVQARAMYAWIDPQALKNGDISRLDARYPHHEVAEDGVITSANLTSCAAVIGMLNGARGGVDLPDADRRGVYEHVAAHLRVAGQEPTPLDREVLVAHAAPSAGPPHEWFADPKLSVPTAITITADGRVYGHAAQWGQCHLGPQMQGLSDCVTPPYEETHPYFMTGELACEDGSVVGVGQITVGTGHAPLFLGASSAAEHYDNTGAAVADVVVGNDRYGIWVAGAIRPDATESQVRSLRAAGQVSGDWRRVAGGLRLVGLLAVNVPGFPVPRAKARVASGAAQALVAAGRLTVAPGGVTLDPETMRALRRAADLIADQIGRPEPRVVDINRDELVARVHGGR